jgi:hypothetical protein
MALSGLLITSLINTVFSAFLKDSAYSAHSAVTIRKVTCFLCSLKKTLRTPCTLQ